MLISYVRVDIWSTRSAINQWRRKALNGVSNNPRQSLRNYVNLPAMGGNPSRFGGLMTWLFFEKSVIWHMYSSANRSIACWNVYKAYSNKYPRTFKLNNDCSVFQAEIFAVRETIGLLANRINGLDRPVTIYVDSQAGLKALNSFTIKSMAVLQCRNALGPGTLQHIWQRIGR